MSRPAGIPRPFRTPPGPGSTSGSGAKTARKNFPGQLVRMLRIAAAFILFMVFAGAVAVIGFPSLDPVAMQRWIDDSQFLFLPVRICVYVVVIWYGPGWRGAAGADRDRARLVLVGIAVALESTGTLRTFL